MSSLQDTPHSPWAQAPSRPRVGGLLSSGLNSGKTVSGPTGTVALTTVGQEGGGLGGAVRRDAGPAGKPDGAAQASAISSFGVF